MRPIWQARSATIRCNRIAHWRGRKYLGSSRISSCCVGRTDGRGLKLMLLSDRRPQNSVYRRSDGAACWSHWRYHDINRTSNVILIAPLARRTFWNKSQTKHWIGLKQSSASFSLTGIFIVVTVRVQGLSYGRAESVHRRSWNVSAV